MEKKYLKGPSPREKRLFYYHQLLTNIQEIKIPILIITLGVALFEVVQFFTMPSELRTSSRKRVYITIVCCILASLCYLIAIFRRIKGNIRRNLLINYSVLFLGVLIFSGGLIESYSRGLDDKKDLPESTKYALEFISSKTEIWLVLLIDMMVGIW